jgi:hypothetical protein
MGIKLAGYDHTVQQLNLWYDTKHLHLHKHEKNVVVCPYFDFIPGDEVWKFK